MLSSGRSVARLACLVLCLLAISGLRAAAQPLPPAGLVKTLSGSAFIVRGEKPLPAAVGQPIAMCTTR